MTTTHIKINDVLPSVTYVATAAQTVFSVPFEFFEVTDLVVTINGTAATYDAAPADATEYSVAGAGDTGGGSITLGAGATLNDRVIIYRDVPVERVTDFPIVGPFQINSLNTDLDRIIAMIQQLERDIGRAILVSYGSTGFTIDTEDAVDGDFLVWNETLGNFEMVQVSIGGGAVTINYNALGVTADTAPPTPTNGTLWWKSDEGRMKIYYDDGDTQQWVDVSPVPAPVTEIDEATVSEILIGSETGKYISPDKFRTATAPATLTDAATIAVDFEAGRNFTVTLTDNRTLGNPTNVQAGDSGTIYVVQDGTGSRTLTLAANWSPIGGTAPTLSTAAGAVDVFSYFARSPTDITLCQVGTAEGGVSTHHAQEWTPNFVAAGDMYIAADVAMTIDQGNAKIGTGTLAYEKSTNAAPSTFGAATLPVTLEAGAWLKVTASGVTGFVATHLVRTA